MDRNKIVKTLEELIEDVIDEGTVLLTEQTTSKDVKGWDSLANIQIVVAVERSFGFRFISDEIMAWNNVGEMIDCIIAKIEND